MIIGMIMIPLIQSNYSTGRKTDSCFPDADLSSALILQLFQFAVTIFLHNSQSGNGYSFTSHHVLVPQEPFTVGTCFLLVLLGCLSFSLFLL